VGLATVRGDGLLTGKEAGAGDAWTASVGLGRALVAGGALVEHAARRTTEEATEMRSERLITIERGRSSACYG